ncbi:hypothetical protein GGR58DRAFT_466935 [Xylaria digitata]|nr:hypothetical protein GGR58DRAFT_466935 [Xylaria digitata]
MASPRYPTEGQQFPSRHPLRNITDRVTNRDSNAKCTKRTKRETPLIKRIASKHIAKLPQALPPPPQPQRSTRPLTGARHHTPNQRVRPGDVIIHQFDNAEQFDGVLRILTRLPAITGLAGLTPHVSYHDRKRLKIRLQYPVHAISRVVDRLHSCRDETVSQLRVCDIRQLCDTVLNNVAILCDAHIPLSSDMSNLRIVHQRKPSPAFLPLFDTFDPSMCAGQDGDSASDWTERKKQMVLKVKTQFRVFELLAQLDPYPRYRRYPDIELDPEDAVRILKANPQPTRPRNLVILHVNRYTPVLSRYTIQNATEHLVALRNRTKPLHPSWKEFFTLYSHTIKHVLRLLDTTNKDTQLDVPLLADRAALWVIYGVILIHLYAKVIESYWSEGVLQIDCPGSADTYTSRVSFNLVTEACYEVREAIRSLYAAGGRLDSSSRYFLYSVPKALKIRHG